MDSLDFMDDCNIHIILLFQLSVLLYHLSNVLFDSFKLLNGMLHFWYQSSSFFRTCKCEPVLFLLCALCDYHSGSTSVF